MGCHRRIDKTRFEGDRPSACWRESVCKALDEESQPSFGGAVNEVRLSTAISGNR